MITACVFFFNLLKFTKSTSGLARQFLFINLFEAQYGLWPEGLLITVFLKWIWLWRKPITNSILADKFSKIIYEQRWPRKDYNTEICLPRFTCMLQKCWQLPWNRASHKRHKKKTHICGCNYLVYMVSTMNSIPQRVQFKDHKGLKASHVTWWCEQIEFPFSCERGYFVIRIVWFENVLQITSRQAISKSPLDVDR